MPLQHHWLLYQALLCKTFVMLLALGQCLNWQLASLAMLEFLSTNALEVMIVHSIWMLVVVARCMAADICINSWTSVWVGINIRATSLSGFQLLLDKQSGSVDHYYHLNSCAHTLLNWGGCLHSWVCVSVSDETGNVAELATRASWPGLRKSFP